MSKDKDHGGSKVWFSRYGGSLVNSCSRQAGRSFLFIQSAAAHRPAFGFREIGSGYLRVVQRTTELDGMSRSSSHRYDFRLASAMRLALLDGIFAINLNDDR